MCLARFDAKDTTLTSLGVGNLARLLVRCNFKSNPPREAVLLRDGLVGLQLVQLCASAKTVFSSDTPVFATDGISRGFGDSLSAPNSPQRVADRIGTEFFNGTDDALVLA